MHLFKRVVASGLAVLITVQTTGCHTWKTVPLPPPSAVSQHPGRKVQVILQDNRRFDADSATTDATTGMESTLLWLYGAGVYRGNSIDTLPLAAVKEVKVREASAGRTVGLVLGIVAGVVGATLGIIWLIECSGEPQGYFCP